MRLKAERHVTLWGTWASLVINSRDSLHGKQLLISLWTYGTEDEAM